jgi:integrase/recombinase XerD
MNTLTPKNPYELIITETLPLDQNPAAVYLSGLRETGRRTQKQSLDFMAGLLTGNPDCLLCNWAGLRYQHTTAIRSKLNEIYKPATVNKMLSALRGVLKQAYLLNQMSADDYQRAIMVKSVEGSTLPRGRELSSGEISALMQACENDKTSAGVRDAAIIAVMYVGGLRREEVTTLDISDYDHDTGKMIIRGKRQKERTAYLQNGAGRAIEDWLNIRGTIEGALFNPINKGGKVTTRRLTNQAIYNMLKKRAEEAGVSEFSPHDLRRTFVSDLLDAGADIAVISKMAGHANVQTTARYDRRPEEAKRKAAGLLHVPYKGKK